MSTRSSLYFDDDTDLHIFLDVMDLNIYMEGFKKRSDRSTCLNLTDMFGAEAMANLKKYLESQPKPDKGE